MSDLQLLVDLHKPAPRLGPGSDAHTRLALELSGLLEESDLNVADLGCGTGASTLVLAEALDARITAVDLFPEFLGELERRAAERGVRERITTTPAAFEDLDFERGSLDAIWSEGAIYNIGFEAGLAAWRPFLRAGGVLAVSELIWLTSERPAELEEYWNQHYPGIDTAGAKFAMLERQGFMSVGYFPLPPSCWMEQYYEPVRARFSAFLEEHGRSEAARACVDAEKAEIAMYERFGRYYSYGFYVARRAEG